METSREERTWIDPLLAFRAAREWPGRVFLDSGGAVTHLSRWSVLAVDPLETLEVRVGSGLSGWERRSSGADPLAQLEALHRRARSELGEGNVAMLEDAAAALRDGAAASGDAREPGGWARTTANPSPDPASLFLAGSERRTACENPPFTGGVIALLGYDLGRSIERLPAIAADDPSLPDLWAGVYAGAVLFDRSRRRIWIASRGPEAAARRKALRAILERASRESGPRPGAPTETSPRPGATPAAVPHDPNGVSRAAYAAGAGESRRFFEAGVERIRRAIAGGEIYQANLTRRVIRAASDASSDSIYEGLRARSPTPFGAYVDAGGFRVLSASPERFLRIGDGIVETRPIKGTRPRGVDREEDEALRTELITSEKERAELLMIVDLERNDLGRIAAKGSVEVMSFPEVEGYSTVWHLSATVRARLRRGAGVVDALRASFPGGSISGAPKIRAMEILEGLEPCRRKFSMGALLAWDIGGNLDSSILIRTIVQRHGEAIFNVGGGIVADSTPRLEWEETIAKAAPLLAALEGR